MAPVTCEQIAELLRRGGREAVAANSEAYEHIGECDACIHRMVAATATATAPSEEVTVPGFPEPGPPASSVPAAAPPPVPQSPPVLPSAQPMGARVGAPPAPPASSFSLPMELPPLPQSKAFEGGRRFTLNLGGRRFTQGFTLKPRQLAFGALGAALIGGVVVGAVVMLVSPTSDSDSEEAPAGSADTAPEDSEPTTDLVDLTTTEFEDDASAIGVEEQGSAAIRRTKRPARTSRVGGESYTLFLSEEDVAKGIRARLRSFSPCLGPARKRGVLEPGKHTIVVSFRIMPNGSVREARLIGPDYLLGKRAANCITFKLRSWRFAPSAKGVAVNNVRLPLNVR